MLSLIQLPSRTDNYIYVASDGKDAFVVDPGESEPVLTWLAGHPAIRLRAALITHHHFDHVGGLADLVASCACAVIGAKSDAARIPHISQEVDIGETIDVAGCRLQVLDVRAHTMGHIAFSSVSTFDRVVRHGHGGQAQDIPRLQNRRVVFVGDSLFTGGCGRLFEGQAQDLKSVMALYREQDGDALLACAHEYTSSNLRFAAHLLPGNAAIKSRLADLDDERGTAKSSVPDTFAREFVTNPYLLAFDAAERKKLAGALRTKDEVQEVLAAARLAKDGY